MKVIIELNHFDMIKPKPQEHLIRKLEVCGIIGVNKIGTGCNVYLTDEEIRHLLKLTRAFYREIEK